MKRIIYILTVFMLFSGSIFAQERLLNVYETTEGIGVYPCGDRHEAMVQFVTSEPFGLEFSSSHDNELNISIDSIAGKKTYSIVFITQSPGMDFSNRKLTIMAPGFQSYRLSLSLRDKQKFEYTVSDPYSALRSPFFVYLEKAQSAFKNGEYQIAKDNYELCRYCPEYLNDTTLINSHIIICDSMMVWNDDALQSNHFSKFKDEAESYSKMLRYNSNEKLYGSLYNAQNNFRRDCAALSRMGESYMNQDNLDKAEAMYRQIIENGCNDYANEASSALLQIHKARQRRNDHARTFMVTWTPNMFGLSWGNYYTSRSHGWYGSIMVNAEDFKLLAQRSHVKGTVTGINKDWDKKPSSSDIEVENIDMDREDLTKEEGKNSNKYAPKDGKLDFEATVSMGCSWHIWEPIFVHFGLGYHGGGFADFDVYNFAKAIDEVDKKSTFDIQNSDTWDDSFKYDYSKINWFNGVAPELGIVLKYWRAAIKVTYQYTFWVNENGYKDLLKDNSHKVILGVGFCW